MSGKPLRVGPREVSQCQQRDEPLSATRETVALWYSLTRGQNASESSEGGVRTKPEDRGQEDVQGTFPTRIAA